MKTVVKTKDKQNRGWNLKLEKQLQNWCVAHCIKFFVMWVTVGCGGLVWVMLWSIFTFMLVEGFAKPQKFWLITVKSMICFQTARSQSWTGPKALGMVVKHRGKSQLDLWLKPLVSWQLWPFTRRNKYECQPIEKTKMCRMCSHSVTSCWSLWLTEGKVDCTN